MSSSTTYASFLVRLWYEPSSEQGSVCSGGQARESATGPPGSVAGWHSEIEQIQSGQRWTFSTLEEMLDFLRRQAEGTW